MFVIVMFSDLALAHGGILGLYFIGILSSLYKSTGFILLVAELIDTSQIIMFYAFSAVLVALLTDFLYKGFANYLKGENHFGRYSFVYYLSLSGLIIVTFFLVSLSI